MARFRYQHIKSSVEGKAPTAAQLKVAEIGVNDFAGDEKLFIKNSTGDVVDFPRGYSREYIDDNERVIAEALNDLNSRKLDSSAYTEIWESGTGKSSAVLKGSSGTASGDYSVAEGHQTSGTGVASHAEGQGTTASGSYSHAEGEGTTASGIYSHAEGYQTQATSVFSHAEGSGTIASNNGAHAEGCSASATNIFSHAEGYGTLASGGQSHAEGQRTIANGSDSHAEGQNTTASGDYSHAEGSGTIASGDSSHAEGNNTIASGNYSHAEGGQTRATSNYSHAEGSNTLAVSSYTHAEGSGTIASGIASHAEGIGTRAVGESSHAEGDYTQSVGNYSHAEGGYTRATSNYSHAEGNGTSATSIGSHAEGLRTIASGNYSHAEGDNTKASGDYSHAEGYRTTASGESSHAEGDYTTASGDYSHAEGQGTTAKNQAEHASGQYNVSSSASTTFGDSGNTLFSVGNGTANNARHNAFEIRQNGDIYIVNKDGDDVRLQDEIGNIDVDQVLDDTTSASTNPVSSKAVYDAVTDNELVWTNAYVALSGVVSSITDDLSTNYYTKDETSGKTEISTALGTKVNSATYTGHTADTEVHFSGDEKEHLDSLATNIAAISGITSTKVSNWDGAATNSHTHSNKTYLDSITGTVGTMAYQNANSYSSATQVSTALADKVDKTEYATFSAATNTSIEDLSGQSETVAAALNDLNAKKLDTTAYTPVDTSLYYKKTETSGATEIQTALSNKADKTAVDDLSGQSETIAAALNDLNTNKADKSTTYTKTEISDALSGKVDTNTFDTIVGSGYTNTTITEVIENMDQAVAAALTDLNDKIGDIESILATI